MAVAQVIGIQELLLMISEKTHSRKLLYNACLVNHAFHDAFTPSLYRCLRWDARNISFLCDEAKLRCLIDSGNLSHTKTIILAGSAVEALRVEGEKAYTQAGRRVFPNDRFPILGDIYSRLDSPLIDICQAAKRLRNFHCRDMTVSVECLDTLSRAKNLRSLQINFPNDDALPKYDTPGQQLNVAVWNKYDKTKISGVPPRTLRFEALERLSITNIYGDLRAWREWITQTMLDSPNIKQLSLSIARYQIKRSRLYPRTNRDDEGNDPESYSNILHYISRKYKEHFGMLPTLQCIRLGLGFRIPANLNHVVNTSELRDIYFLNLDWTCKCPMDISSLKVTPPLTKLSLRWLSLDPWQSNSTWEASRALISFRVHFWPDLERYPDYRLTTPRLFELSRSLLGHNVGEVIPLLPAVCKGHMQYSLEALEGSSSITDLIIRWRGHRHLGIARSEAKLELEGICKILEKLYALQNLWVIAAAQSEDLYCFAKVAAETLKSLKYIRFGQQARAAWRIHRHASTEDVLLEALDEWEDEVEGPDFFHVPQPLPNSHLMDHVDWDCT
ncbi:hypothetical protein F5Y10DRAFT_68524 [Nemania abortiva]|nr:hypothetical protein F5Y10DRAFT_68524 [Nemania abortiva]